MTMILNSTTTYVVKFTCAEHITMALSDNLVEAVANYIEFVQDAEYDEIMSYDLDLYNHTTGEVLAYRYQNYEGRVMNTTTYDTEEFLDALVEAVKIM